jgi:exopolyphosphatase/guanosine-5'-triphosphate,3'-diphosphate pyrophosphatase
MRLGIIDLGTNSIRFDAYEMRTKQPQLLHRERLMVRLGEGVFANGYMANEAIARTLGAFVGFKYTAEQIGVTKIVAVATSALRHASNRQKLIDSVKIKTGIEIQVISGKAEARFIARGVLSRELKLPEKLALVDIGGGSTEISLSKKRQILWSTSFDLGTARIDQLFRLSEAGITVANRLKKVRELRKHIKNTFKEFSQKNQWTRVSTLIGTSGTVKALVMLQQTNSKNKILTAIFLKKLIRKMLKLDRSQLLKIPGMDISRVDMILGGAVLLDEIMTKSGAIRVQLSEFALREGVLDEESALIRDYKDSSLAHHLRDLEDHLQISLTALPYARQITLISEKLFDVLMPVHRLGSNWKAYLAAAAMLQNTGKAISPVKHNKHSFYIVSNLDFPWLDLQDRKILAHMCLWHSTVKVTNKELTFLKEAATKRSFLRTLAILQIANALFWHDRASVKIIKSQLKPGQVHLKIVAKDAHKLLRLRVEARSKLFLRVFKRSLVLV